MLVRIGKVSRMLNISVRRILQYEEEGLIIPTQKTTGGHRLYSEYDVHHIKNIMHLIHDRGLTLAGIKYILKMSPCWEIFPCPEKDNCKAFKKPYSTCWKVRQEKKGECSCMGDCARCPVYLVRNYETKPLFPTKTMANQTDSPNSN